MKKLNIVAWSLVAGILVLAGVAVAGTQRSDRMGNLTPWKAMSLAEQKTGGRAIEAVYEFDDGHWGYAVYVVAKHKLWEVEMDKDSGRLGDVEEANPSGEAKELEGDLKRAMR